jgi:hypothetical protein
MNLRTRTRVNLTDVALLVMMVALALGFAAVTAKLVLQ